jgi:hypothetical protein
MIELSGGDCERHSSAFAHSAIYTKEAHVIAFLVRKYAFSILPYSM